MQGSAAQSSKYFYYTCKNVLQRGKTLCDAKMVRREKIESFIIERLKSHLLTEKNILELVKLTNEEISNSEENNQEQLLAIENQTNDVQKRLDKLYSALETGALELSDLSPRIQALRKQMNELQAQRNDISIAMSESFIQVTKEEIGRYVQALRVLLDKGSIMDQKAFLRSFIKRIELQGNEVSIEYTTPLETVEKSPGNLEILSLVENGGPSVTRTRDLTLIRGAL